MSTPTYSEPVLTVDSESDTESVVSQRILVPATDPPSPNAGNNKRKLLSPSLDSRLTLLEERCCTTHEIHFDDISNWRDKYTLKYKRLKQETKNNGESLKNLATKLQTLDAKMDDLSDWKSYADNLLSDCLSDALSQRIRKLEIWKNKFEKKVHSLDRKFDSHENSLLLNPSTPPGLTGKFALLTTLRPYIVGPTQEHYLIEEEELYENGRPTSLRLALEHSLHCTKISKDCAHYAQLHDPVASYLQFTASEALPNPLPTITNVYIVLQGMFLH